MGEVSLIMFLAHRDGREKSRERLFRTHDEALAFWNAREGKLDSEGFKFVDCEIIDESDFPDWEED